MRTAFDYVEQVSNKLKISLSNAEFTLEALVEEIEDAVSGSDEEIMRLVVERFSERPTADADFFASEAARQEAITDAMWDIAKDVAVAGCDSVQAYIRKLEREAVSAKKDCIAEGFINEELLKAA